MSAFDAVIVGGGIVGLATAYRLGQRRPGLRLVVLEKEAAVAQHQTGRNSGVIHSGVYYRPGSLKATNCRAGRAALLAFCEAEGIPFELSGKVIVAVEEDERERLHAIAERGRENGVACRLIGSEELGEREPHVRGVEALHVPEAGVVDYGAVSRRLAERVAEAGHEVRTGAAVRGVHRGTDGLTLETDGAAVRARHLVNCAGLWADRLARQCGDTPLVQIVPFRGDYFEVRPEAHALCRALVYPVPDPAFPFLGVHFTRHIDGSVTCGPSAVLAFAREGYRFGTVRPGELGETLRFRGFWRLAARHWRYGLAEMGRALSKRRYLAAAQRLVPAVQAEDLAPAPSGVRAQAVTPEGALVDDFLITTSERAVHVLSAASPAATASLNIGAVVADRVLEQMG